MLSAIDYVGKISMTPDDYWNSLAQATIIERWDDTTQIYDVKEQKALPFVDEYDEYEAWVNTISDGVVNTSKVYSDFVDIMFKNLKHKQNYKGQYYKFKPDGVHEETYICYDRMNSIGDSNKFKCVRCNNVLTWIDEYKNIITLPCYIGNDITSTNNLISKDGVINEARLVVLVQANEFTQSIVINQRFMFQHSSAFKVEEVNNFMQEEGTNGLVTCIKLYVEYSPMLPTDNKELNICDYYNIDYNLKINQGDIKNIKGFNGNLTATLKNNNDIISLPLVWESSDKSVVRIDDNGNYTITGNDGTTAIITCYMKDNMSIKDSINLEVVSSGTGDKVIVVTPNDVSLLKENQKVDFDCGVYIDGVIQPDIVTCVASNVDKSCYVLDGYSLTIKKKSTLPLILTFSADGCDDVIFEIKLRGLI